MRRFYLTVRIGLTYLGLAWVLVTLTPVTRWYAAMLAGPWLEPKGDILIVLGADEPTDGLIGPATYWRSLYAVRAWREGGFRWVVVSGGNGLADSMKDFLQFEGVPGDKIVVERRALSTRENALYTADLLNHMTGPKVLLTSDFHVYRSVRAFQKVGLPVLPRFFPYAFKRFNSWPERWPLFMDLCIETVKIVRYRISGWI